MSEEEWGKSKNKIHLFYSFSGIVVGLATGTYLFFVFVFSIYNA